MTIELNNQLEAQGRHPVYEPLVSVVDIESLQAGITQELQKPEYQMVTEDQAADMQNNWSYKRSTLENHLQPDYPQASFNRALIYGLAKLPEAGGSIESFNLVALNALYQLRMRLGLSDISPSMSKIDSQQLILQYKGVIDQIMDIAAEPMLQKLGIQIPSNASATEVRGLFYQHFVNRNDLPSHLYGTLIGGEIEKQLLRKTAENEESLHQTITTLRTEQNRLLETIGAQTETIEVMTQNEVDTRARLTALQQRLKEILSVLRVDEHVDTPQEVAAQRDLELQIDTLELAISQMDTQPEGASSETAFRTLRQSYFEMPSHRGSLWPALVEAEENVLVFKMHQDESKIQSWLSILAKAGIDTSIPQILSPFEAEKQRIAAEKKQIQIDALDETKKKKKKTVDIPTTIIQPAHAVLMKVYPFIAQTNGMSEANVAAKALYRTIRKYVAEVSGCQVLDADYYENYPNLATLEAERLAKRIDIPEGGSAIEREMYSSEQFPDRGNWEHVKVTTVSSIGMVPSEHDINMDSSYQSIKAFVTLGPTVN